MSKKMVIINYEVSANGKPIGYFLTQIDAAIFADAKANLRKAAKLEPVDYKVKPV